jgi:PLP dependent protein
MNQIGQQLIAINDRVVSAAKNAGRDPAEITLIAVTKGRDVSQIQSAIEAGQMQFGENYVQEALKKIEHFETTFSELNWHFIGPLQSNKAKYIAKQFSWVQSIDREKVALLLNQHRPVELPPLNVCIEVNISAEQSKSGISPDEIFALAEKILQMPKLRLRGIMAIPAVCDDYSEQRKVFHKLKQIFLELKEKGLQLDTLSMGMTDDFEAAIAEGSTMIRVGRAIFN